jgi:hypothetical protein
LRSISREPRRERICDLAETPQDRARTATGEELASLIHHPSPEVLRALLDNPAFDEELLSLLLQRRDLQSEVLEDVALRRHFLKNYKIKRALALHPHTPRLITLRLLRDLYLMDLVQVTLTPGISMELRRNAEDQVVARLPQLPLGQKITLARRGPARVAGMLLVEGHPQMLPVVLDNPNLTEAQVLKALSREKTAPATVRAVSQHAKWSHTYNVRLALVRNSASTLSTVLSYLPELTVSDLRELVAPGVVPEALRKYLQAEIQRRLRRQS